MNLNALKAQVRGRMVLPTDNDYDEARKIYNAMIDKRPAAILYCENEADVARGIVFARDNKVSLAIRSGGHNGPGLCLCNDGLVLDLSQLNDIKVDTTSDTAVIGPGNTLADIDKGIHPHGYALPFGINGTTGIAGLTLGGGVGYLSRKEGLTIDSLLAARVVLASGDIVDCDTANHPDLFWAIRGGGGNFGVVVAFTFRLTRLTNVYGGPMIWPLEKAREVMKFYDAFTKTADRDLYGFFAFLIVPPGPPFPEEWQGKNTCGIVWNYTGQRDKAEEVFKPVRDAIPPVIDFTGDLPVPALNTMFDALYPPGMQWYWKGLYLTEMSDACIEANIKHGSRVPSMNSTMHYYPIDGKVHDVASDATAWVNRDCRWAQVIVGVDPDPANKDKITKWCKDYYDEMVPFSKSGSGYVNFMMADGNGRVKSAYGVNYERLTRIKSQYDPDNLFRLNQNIEPQ